MTLTTPSDLGGLDWRLAAVLTTFVLMAGAVSWVAHLSVARDDLLASIRATVQLAVVALVLAAVLTSIGWSVAFVALMVATATVTTCLRVGVELRRAPWLTFALAAGSTPVVGLCLASGAIPLNGTGIIPIAGIVLGGTMMTAVLAGRRAFDELVAHRPQWEAALALGMRPYDATQLIINRTAREALLPTLDQTRTVGLVSLPGTFVGVILGGGSALQAGAAQLLVLVGLLPAQAVTTAVVHHLIAGGQLRRARN